MSNHRRAVIALSLGLALAPTGSAQAQSEPSSSSTVSPAETAGETTPLVWLSGPFGHVPGGTAQEPATAAPDAVPLDTWMRSANLELVVELPAEDLLATHVVARSLEGTGLDELLATDDGWFAGPDRAGPKVITATIESATGGTTDYAWLVEVPDREGSWETFLEMPAVESELRSEAGSVDGIRGHGCYVGMCQEVGGRPPPDTLTPLEVAVGETPELRLSDGSALVHWEGRLEPLSGTAAETRLAKATYADEAVAAPQLAGLEPTMPGEWLLELRADYDRERGWQWFLYRLVTP